MLVEESNTLIIWSYGWQAVKCLREKGNYGTLRYILQSDDFSLRSLIKFLDSRTDEKVSCDQETSIERSGIHVHDSGVNYVKYRHA